MPRRRARPQPPKRPDFALEVVVPPAPRPDPGAQPYRLSRRGAREVREIGYVPLEFARWPANFVAAVEVGAAALRELPADATEEQRAVAMMVAVARWLGPGRHYWPNAEELRVAARDWRIYNREFDGRNTAGLAARYGLSIRGIQVLLKRQREHQLAVRRRRSAQH